RGGVEGAPDSTKLLRRKRNVEARAPSTTVRSLRELQWSPSPAIAGAEGASDRVLAAPFAPEVCSKNESNCCFASEQKGRRSAGRRSTGAASSDAARALRLARSPLGAPPRLWPRFLGLGFSTSGQVSWDAAVCGRYPRLPVPVQR